MECESFFEDMRGLGVAAGSACSFEVVHEGVSVVRMSDVVDDDFRSFFRGQAANIGNALFGNEHMGVVFGVVHMGAHRNDRGDIAVLRGAVAEEAGEVRVACEVAGTADAVHHLRARYMGGVHVAVDIHFQSGIHADDADTANDFTVVGDLFRTEDDLLAVFVNVLVEALQAFRRRGQGRTGDHVDLAGIDQVEHAVLDDFRVDGEVFCRNERGR